MTATNKQENLSLWLNKAHVALADMELLNNSGTVHNTAVCYYALHAADSFLKALLVDNDIAFIDNCEVNSVLKSFATNELTIPKKLIAKIKNLDHYAENGSFTLEAKLPNSTEIEIAVLAAREVKDFTLQVLNN